MKLPEHLQGLSKQPPIVRIFTASFDKVEAKGEFYEFYHGGVKVGTYRRDACNERQQNFFDAISDPPG